VEAEPVTARAGWRRWLVVAGAMVLAALVRVAAMFYHDISGDDATVALIAEHYRTGEAFPAFFYRQTYMGTLNGIHLVPALAVFGPSVLLVRLNAIGWSLLFPLGLYALGRRIFDEATARVALLLAAVPPFLLTYWSTVAEPHFETNLFGLLLLLLALAAARTPPGPRYLRVLACFGLTAGLAWWTNYKALEVIVPCLAVLWWRDRRLPLGRGALALAGGFLLGSLPVWLFHAAAGGGGHYTRELFAAGWFAPLRRLGALFGTVVPTLLGTYYWDVEGLPRRVVLLLNVAVYAVAVGVVLVDAVRRRDAATPDARWGRPLLLLTLAAPLAVLYVSALAREVDHETARYVLPVYIPLLLCAAVLVVRLWRRSRVAGAVVLAYLLAFDLWTHGHFFWPLDPDERARRATVIATRAGVARALRARPVEALYTDEQFASLKWAFLLPGLPVSEATAEIVVPHAVAADAANRITLLAVRAGDDPGPQLDALGVGYRRTDFIGAVLFEDLQARPGAYRMFPREAWRVVALADGDYGTAWPPAAAPTAEAVVVDLGATQPVGRLVWWPASESATTRPLAVSVSADGLTWQPAGVQPDAMGRPGYVAAGRPLFRPRNGWLELRFPARPTRFVRFAPADAESAGWWGIAELYAYAEGAGPPGGPPDAGRLVDRLRTHGVTRLLADPVISARVAGLTGGAIRTRTANGARDSHGDAPPARLADWVGLRVSDALLVPAEDADDLRTRLRSDGLGFAAEPLDGYVLFHGVDTVWRWPCHRTRWRTTAEGVDAELSEPREVVGVRLEHPPALAPRVPVPAVAVAVDGEAWRPVAALRRHREWAWAGRTLLALATQTEELVFAPARARRVRVTLRLPEGEGARVEAVCVRTVP